MNLFIKKYLALLGTLLVIFTNCGTPNWKTTVENLLKEKQYEIADAILVKSAANNQNTPAYHLFKLEILSGTKPVSFINMQMEADWIKNNIDSSTIVHPLNLYVGFSWKMNFDVSKVLW